MKRVLFILLLMCFFSASYAGDPPKGGDAPVAIVMKTIKEVSLKKDKTDWKEAKVGIPLATNDEIKTGDKSLALIKFTDNSILRVRENSSLKIYADKTKGDLSKNTYIDKGKVGFNVTKQQNEEFKFTTPTMVASIRGTEGYFDVDQSGQTILVCFQGSIGVQATQGQRDNTTVSGGSYVQVGTTGTITGGTNTPQMNNTIQNLRQTTPKKMIIKTNQGDLIIEYLGND